MEHANSLQKLTDAADLLAMVDALLSTPSIHLTPAIMAGLRQTVRSSREMVLNGHDSIASGLLARNRPASTQASSVSSVGDDANRIEVRRRDLRASIERMTESRATPGIVQQTNQAAPNASTGQV